jgi:hypothetical protein
MLPHELLFITAPFVGWTRGCARSKEDEGSDKSSLDAAAVNVSSKYFWKKGWSV